MKTVRNSLFFSLLLLSMVLVTLAGFVAERDASRAIASQSHPLTLDEAAPELAAVAEGATVALGWTEVLGAKGYRLLFSFNYGDTADEPYEIDMGYETELTLDFDSEAILDTFDNFGSCETIEAGLTFYVRVEAYDQEGNSRQSNAEYVLVGANDYRSQGDDTVGGGEQPSAVSARVAAASCLLPGQPWDSCVAILHGIHICVPVGGTSAFTPNGSINGYTPISRDPSITTCGYDSGGGWVTGISEGITIVDIWNSAGCVSPMTVQVVPPGAYYIYVSYLDPAPYPASSLTAGAQVTISCVLTFTPVSDYQLWLTGFYGNWDSAAEPEAGTQVMHAQRLESTINPTDSSEAVSYTLDVLTGYDYVVVWFELRASDGTTMLARTCSTGWLIY